MVSTRDSNTFPSEPEGAPAFLDLIGGNPADQAGATSLQPVGPRGALAFQDGGWGGGAGEGAGTPLPSVSY